MEWEDAVNVAHIVDSLNKIDLINEKVINLLQNLYIEDRPSAEVMSNIINGVNKAFTDITDKLKDELEKY